MSKPYYIPRILFGFVALAALLVPTERAPLLAQDRSGLVESMQLLAPNIGWVLVDGRLWWTADNGQNWSDISPSGSQSQRIEGVFFLNASRGWVTVQDGWRDGIPALSLASTADSGQRWETQPIDLAAFQRLRAYVGSSTIFFLDSAHGWIMLRLASSSNFSFGALLATEDGGQSWMELSSPPAANPVRSPSP